MKKLIQRLLISGLFLMFITMGAQAQFRSIPGVVTDSFKIKYPNAQNVNWSDEISNFKASFKLDTAKYTAKYSSKGEWQQSETTISWDALPAAVKDGFSKSKYATEWSKSTVTTRYLPGNQIQYLVGIYKNSFQKKTLVFSPDGRLLKD